MREKPLKILPSLTIPRIIAAGLAVALGVNGIVQLGLQRDMKTKAGQLKQQVTTAQRLSGQLNSGLSNLVSIQQSTLGMKQTLGQLESVTGDMDHGLQQLSSTVAGIDTSVKDISSSTGNANQSAQDIAANLKPLVGLLISMQATNQGMEANLAAMANDEKAIDSDLAQMDKKTSLLP